MKLVFKGNSDKTASHVEVYLNVHLIMKKTVDIDLPTKL